ncbi:Uncharacterised protein [Mycobacteroides abscessus subsp. abscessus]|nr:Uncharacterised protein [Mycobacteroides abscessus subsp. abscessus]
MDWLCEFMSATLYVWAMPRLGHDTSGSLTGARIGVE